MADANTFCLTESSHSRGQLGFSLVEVTIAMGIFAFAIVAILGLFPVALKQRSDAALETRAVLISQQIFEGIRSSSSTNAIFLPPLLDMSATTNKLTSKPIVNFPLTLQYGRVGTTATGVGEGQQDWLNGIPASNEADTLVRIRITAEPTISPAMYRATVDIGRPGSLPEAKRRNLSFAKLFHLP